VARLILVNQGRIVVEHQPVSVCFEGFKVQGSGFRVQGLLSSISQPPVYFSRCGIQGLGSGDITIFFVACHCLLLRKVGTDENDFDLRMEGRIHHKVCGLGLEFLATTGLGKGLTVKIGVSRGDGRVRHIDQEPA